MSQGRLNVVRAMAACRVPIVSAVGHEVDVTLADLVADVRAATPSNAAELVVPDGTRLLSELEAAERRLSRGLEAVVGRGRLSLERLGKSMPHPLRRVAERRASLRLELGQSLASVGQLPAAPAR